VEGLDALFAAEGDRAGAEFRPEPGARRLANLVDKGAAFEACIVEPARLWHAGTANRTPRRRLALHAFCCRRNKPQQQDQPRWLPPETVARRSPEARAVPALDDHSTRTAPGPRVDEGTVG